MLKTLTLSLSLALALGFCGVSKAGGLFHGDSGCTTCGIASPQGPVVSPQCPLPSARECYAPVKEKCHLFSGLGHMGNKMSCGFNDLCAKLKPKPACYTYEWVLKKKRVWGHHNPCGTPACETCAVYPSGQGSPSPQAGYSSPQTYGTGQAGTYGTGQFGTYGASQAPYGATQAPATAGSMTPALGADEAPPAPEVAPSTPSMPAAPAVPSIPAPPAPPAPPATSGLLFSTPSGK